MSIYSRKKGRSLSGWIILDKPVGLSSSEAVLRVKRIFEAQKAGHAGTLDPLASGILPIALGEATKIIPHMQDGSKIYRFTVSWGEERTTDDCEGSVSERSGKYPEQHEIQSIMPKYIGSILQVPPQFSAVKIEGKRAYSHARKGEFVEISPRKIEINRFELLHFAPEHTVFEVQCGKGTYIRSLARDLGRDLGCFGYVSMLRRMAVEPFSEKDCITLDELERISAGLINTPEALDESRKMDSLLINPCAGLRVMPELQVSREEAKKIGYGSSIPIHGKNPINKTGKYVHVTSNGDLVAIGEIESNIFKPNRVFQSFHSFETK